MISKPLDGRLASAAGFVRAGAVFADIGTDHGYLPIFLLKAGVAKYCYLTDINEGPLASARRNIEAAGLSERADFRLCDGADGLSGLPITDYAICGMGGELIAEIVGRCPDMKCPGVRLILQPMSKQAHLRGELARLGFSVLSERYSQSEGKFYLCLLAEYSGVARTISEEESELGLSDADPDSIPEQIGYLRSRLASYERAMEGKRRGGGDFALEERLCRGIAKRISELERK